MSEQILQSGSAASGNAQPHDQAQVSFDDTETRYSGGEALRADDRPEIMVTVDEHLVNNAAVDALRSDPEIFQRAGALVQVIRVAGQDRGITRPEKSPIIAPLRPAVLRERLAQAARFVTKTSDGQTERVHPPSWCVAAVRDRGQYPKIRSLQGVTETPVLRPDGTILQEAGYDEATGLLYLPVGEAPRIPVSPSRDQAVAAIHQLLDLVCDFPFQTEAHRSTWLAALLTVVGRYAIDGPVPLYLFDANVRGSGKTLLTETISVIATGRKIPRSPNPRNEEEARKMILAVALSGDSLVLIDNVAGYLGSAALDAALTGTSWRDRILGKTRMVKAPLLVTWLATGNNVTLRADTCRRVAHCRLNSLLENPEEREGFRYLDLLSHVTNHRNELLGAALTILRAYFVAPRPQSQLRPWGSFEIWSGLIRQCILWLGLPDPGDTREELRTMADQEAQILAALLRSLQAADRDGNGMTAVEIIEAIKLPGNESLRDAVNDLCDTTSGQPPTPRALGNKLRGVKRRIMGGRALEMREGPHGFAKWRVDSTASLAGSAPTGAT